MQPDPPTHLSCDEVTTELPHHHHHPHRHPPLPLHLPGHTATRGPATGRASISQRGPGGPQPGLGEKIKVYEQELSALPEEQNSAVLPNQKPKRPIQG